MEITIAEFVPTLNEYVDVHIKNPDPEIKIKVDDFCDFPGPENCQSKIEKIKKKKRNSLFLNGLYLYAFLIFSRP